jgi:type II secretory pathway predicted ATPase ExeA
VEHLSTFGLTRDPFANEPQLDLFFESQSVREAATRLRRAAQQGKGLVVLTGAGGLGKTMLVRHVLEGLEEEVFEPCLLVPVPGVSDGGWVLDRLARQLGVESPSRERSAVLTEVYEKLAIVREEGRHVVVILDEAQVLAEQGVLRELRGLLNLEYEERRLLTLVLVGLPALANAVANESALAERVDVPLRLAPLTPEESSRYLTHRIRAAGGNPAIVESSGVAALVKWGGGVPRMLNRLADAALFEAHMAGRVSATAADVERAAAELELRPPDGAASQAAAFVEPPALPEPLARKPEPVAKRPEPPRKPAPPEPMRAAPPAPARRPTPAPAVTRPVLIPAPPVAPSAAAAKRASSRDLDALFDEPAEPAIELEEVVAIGTDPMRGMAGPTVAILDDSSDLDASFEAAFDPASEPEPEVDAAAALFAEDDMADAPAIPLRSDDSSGDLDDLFADLVKDE